MDAIVGNANGSTFQEIRRAISGLIPVVVPSDPILESYRKSADSTGCIGKWQRTNSESRPRPTPRHATAEADLRRTAHPRRRGLSQGARAVTFNPDIHHRRSVRLRGYDYAQAGAYFVTICTQNRECLFGEIVDGMMVLNDAGRMVKHSWQWLASQYDYVGLDAWVVMPNHLHGIIVIADGDGRGGSRTALIDGDGGWQGRFANRPN
ncbi:MAG: transposase [Pseudomonadales bacterium]